MHPVSNCVSKAPNFVMVAAANGLKVEKFGVSVSKKGPLYTRF